MQIKSAMIFHLMLIRMADRQAGRRKKEGKKRKRNVSKDEKKNEHITLLVRLKDGAIAMENIMEVPQKVKTRTTKWRSNFTSGYISQRTESRDSNRDLYANSQCNITHTSQKVKATQMSINRWTNKPNAAQVYRGILFSHRKEWRCDTLKYEMNFENMLSKVSWNKRTNIYGLAYARFLEESNSQETESNVVVTRGWREGETGSYYLKSTEFQFWMMQKLWRWMIVMVKWQCECT